MIAKLENVLHFETKTKHRIPVATIATTNKDVSTTPEVGFGGDSTACPHALHYLIESYITILLNMQ